MNKSTAIVIVAMGAILWGFVGFCSRPMADAGLNAIQINALRSIISFVILGVILLIVARQDLIIKNKKDIVWLILLAMAKFLMDVCYIQSQLMIDLSLAGILLCTDSYFTLIISIVIFRGGVTPTKVIATFLGFFGCTLVMNLYSGVDKINFEGIMFGLGSGFFGALYALGVKKSMNDGYKPHAILFYMFLIGAIIYLPIMDIPTTIDITFGNSDAGIYALALSILFTLLPYFLYTNGLNYLEPIVALVVLYFEAVSSAVVGVVFFGENMTFFMIVGMVLVLTSTILIETKIFDLKKKEDRL